MSVPASIARREAIERAQGRARERFITWQQEQVRIVERMIGALADEIVEELAGYAVDGVMPPEALALFETWLSDRLARFDAEWIEDFRSAHLVALARGAGTFAEGAAASTAIGRAQRFLDEFVAADGLQVSDRVWRIRRRTHAALLAAIRTGVVRGADAARMAEELLAAGRGVPANVSAAARSASTAALGRGVRDALGAGGGGAQFNVTRLLRTESNRAFTEGFVASLHGVPGVAGVKFTLSSLHPRPDACDLHAAANLHGMGPGVYPLGQHPYPAHPMTLSYLQPVFVEEITDQDRAGRETAFDWLRRQPRDRAESILGGHKKAAAFYAGRLQESDLRLPWYFIAERLGETP